MIGMIGDLLLHPDAFFQSRMKDPEQLKVPGLIVVVGGIIAAITGYIISGMYGELLSGLTGGMGPIFSVIGAVTAFFGFIIISWLIFAVVFFLISMVFSGKGSFKRTLEFIGYGLIPVIIGSVITLIISLYYIPLVHIPVISSVTNPAAIQQAMNQITADPAYREYMLMSSVVSIIFTIWSANLWIFGVKHARDLPIKKAAISVLIPVVVYIVYILYIVIVGVQIPGGP